MADVPNVSTAAIQLTGEALRELKPLPERRNGRDRRKHPPEVEESPAEEEDPTDEEPADQEGHQLDVSV